MSDSEQIAQLSLKKRELLLKRLTKAGTQIQPQPRDSNYFPLSFAQQRLWFLDQLVPGSFLYNENATLRLLFPLNVALLGESLNEIVRRHEALRTTFEVVDGQPLQVIAPALIVPLPVVDLRELPELRRETEALRLATEEAQRPFDLARGPLMRTTLLRLGEHEYMFLLTMHHIVGDGWSMSVFSQELAAIYAAFSMGQPSPLPDLPIQYADFAVWQRQWLQGEVLETQLTYWKQQLADLPGLQLPTDRTRPAVQTFQGARQAAPISTSLAAALRALSQREGVTLFMTLLAAFQILLHRYTGQDDLVVGVPTANRTRVELEGLIGFFVNTLVMRTDVAGNPSVREVLRRVREVALGAYAHQDLPFERLVEELHPERDMSRNPLFQVAFQLFSSPTSSELVSEDLLRPIDVEMGAAKFDLRLDLWDVAEGLSGFFEYNTDLFDAATITRLIGHFQTLLAGMVANPEQRLSELPLLTELERHHLLVEGNATETDYPKDQCIHELFEAQVEQTPEAVAVAFADEQLSYRELNQCANQLAHYLQVQGVGPEVLVAVCMERSLEMVVGLLGILKAGGAYVPLDPTYPEARLAFMLQDSQAPLLLTQERLSDQLPEHLARVVCVDSGWSGIARFSQENLASGVRAEHLAYVIYTSGSTGTPKGVAVSHQAVNRLVWNTNYIALGASDKVAQASNASFDAATFEIWGALLHGARLVGVSKEVVLSPDEFAAQLRQHEISVLFLTTELFNQLASQRPGVFQSVRTVLFGGSAVDPRWVKEVLHEGEPQRLLHVYGPTESTTFASWQLVRDVPENALTIPIGGPIANTQVYVVDGAGQVVPVGVPGEVVIGGAGLARGYWRRLALTAAQFRPHAFGPGAGARGYWSGDRGRYRADGALEFVGRLDQQVKLRGFRVELGEIEAVLQQAAGVREAVVLVREDSPGSKRLVAYLVPAHEPAPAVSDLRRFLQARLPDYMVPAAFVLLERLPLTPNGKVDRAALPAPSRGRPSLEATYVAPRTAVEAQLAAIWAQVLGLERVGIEDNFFELGGDSILSIQVIARATQAGLRLTLKQLFQQQTIAALAAVVDTTPPLVAEQGVVRGPVPLTPVQQWFFEADLVDPHHFNQALLLEVRQALRPAWLAQAVQEVLAHHDALRLRFVRQATGWQQVHAEPTEAAPVAWVDLSAVSAAAQRQALAARAAEAQASLDLAAGPLVRVVLFELGPTTPNRLLVVIHHLVVDAVSWGLVLEDLWTAYTQLSRGDAVQLPAKTTAFQQWAERLTTYAQSAALGQEQAYWLAEPGLRGVTLPTDYAGGENTEASARTLTVGLSAAATQALLQEVPKAYQTQINEVLLTAVVQAFATWTGVPALRLELEGHGREALFDDVDLSRTVGWFTTIFPVRLELAAGLPPGEALKAVKEQLRRLPSRGLGYGVLRYLRGEAAVVQALQAQPPAAVSFNYLGQFGPRATAASPFALAREGCGPTSSLRQPRRHLLDITGSVTDGCLQLHWTYSAQVHHEATITALAQAFIQALHMLIAHCQAPEAGGYTPSDFAKAKLSQRELDTLMATVNRTQGRPSA